MASPGQQASRRAIRCTSRRSRSAPRVVPDARTRAHPGAHPNSNEQYGQPDTNKGARSKRTRPAFCYLPLTMPAILSEMDVCLRRSSPQNETETIPGPTWQPMVGPILVSRNIVVSSCLEISSRRRLASAGASELPIAAIFEYISALRLFAKNSAMRRSPFCVRAQRPPSTACRRYQT